MMDAVTDDLVRRQIGFTGMVDDGPLPGGPSYMRASHYAVFIARADGSDLRCVSRDTDPDALQPVWEATGTILGYSVAYRRDFRQMRRYRIRLDESTVSAVALTGETPELTLCQLYGYNHASSSPDGQLCAVTHPDDHSTGGFRIVTSQGESVAHCASSYRYAREPTWSPDGQWIAFAAVPPNDEGTDDSLSLFVLERATGITTYVCDALSFDPCYFCWSPDSRSLVTVRMGEEHDATFIVERDGTHLRKIVDLNIGDTSGEIRATKPAWSSDGRYLAVSTLADVEAFEINIFTVDGNLCRRLAWSSPLLEHIADLTWCPTIDDYQEEYRG